MSCGVWCHTVVYLEWVILWRKNVFVYIIIVLCRSVWCSVERTDIQRYIFYLDCSNNISLRTLQGDLNWIPWQIGWREKIFVCRRVETRTWWHILTYHGLVFFMSHSRGGLTATLELVGCVSPESPTLLRTSIIQFRVINLRLFIIVIFWRGRIYPSLWVDPSPPQYNYYK